MNKLIISQSLTMSSLEVSDLTGKRHDNVMVDTEKLLNELGLNTPDFSGVYLAGNNQEYMCFNLPKRECLILISGYSVSLRAKIIDRWQELEMQQAPKLPQTFAEALQLAADQAKQLELAAPKVAFVDKCVERSTLLTASQVGQKHKLSAIKLNKFLDELGGVYNKGVKRGRVFCQPFIDKGYGELKQTEMGHSQALFTTLGEQWINKKLITEGLI